jgi:hypothetical protein|eukprot:SAG25_NODE_1502_length_2884_cov_2.245601_2_plen_149_part_00
MVEPLRGFSKDVNTSPVLLRLSWQVENNPRWVLMRCLWRKHCTKRCAKTGGSGCAQRVQRECDNVRRSMRTACKQLGAHAILSYRAVLSTTHYCCEDADRCINLYYYNIIVLRSGRTRFSRLATHHRCRRKMQLRYSWKLTVLQSSRL